MKTLEEYQIEVQTVTVGGTLHPTNQGCPGEEDLYDDVHDVYVYPNPKCE